jgi:F-type H+-transporting ATPase subunit delta
MSGEAVARRYARAVFELARDEGRVAEIARELGAFAEAYESSSDFRAMAHTPALGDSDREAVVREMASRLGVSETARRTVTLLAERQRLSVLPDLVRQLRELADDHLGVIRARVKSARALSPAYVERLKQRIEEATGKQVLLEVTEDPSLIAGVLTEIGDRVIDGSVRGRLNRLADSLHEL